MTLVLCAAIRTLLIMCLRENKAWVSIQNNKKCFLFLSYVDVLLILGLNSNFFLQLLF